MVTHQLQVKRGTGKVCQSKTYVLTLCNATNQPLGNYEDREKPSRSYSKSAAPAASSS